MGWSKERIEFYNEGRKQWRDIAFTNNHGLWLNLEETWDKYAEVNDFGNIYSQKITRIDISSNASDYGEAQEEELPADCFCVQDEINDCPWKENKKGEHEDNDNGSDDEYGCSRPWKRAMDGSHHLPQVSTDCYLNSLLQHDSEKEYGGSSDGEGDRWCGI
jgi:hypothetical protein